MVIVGGPSPGMCEGLVPTVGGDRLDGGDGPIKPIGPGVVGRGKEITAVPLVII